MRNQQFEGEPLEFGQYGLRGRPGIVIPDGDFVEGPDGDMRPVPRGIDKERGSFVLVPDGQGGRKRMWRERGQLFVSPDDANNLLGRPVDVANEIYRPQVAPTPRGEGRRLAEQDRAQGASEVRRFERFERGDLTPEMEARARLDAAKASNEVFLKDPNDPNKFLTNKGARPIEVYKDERGIVRGMPRKPGSEKPIVAKPFNEVSPDDAKSAILGQLQARKEANRSGRRARIMQANNEDAGLEAVLLGNESRLRGRQLQKDNRISVLGQLKGDRLKKNMGLQLGNQRATTENAIR